MRQPRVIIWTERALVILILASLAGTVNLVVAVHRRAATTRVASERAIAPPPAAPRPVPVPAPPAPLVSKAKSPRLPVPPPRQPEDPTKKALSALELATAREIEAAKQADRRALSLET